jgi:hypothetical protein
MVEGVSGAVLLESVQACPPPAAQDDRSAFVGLVAGWKTGNPPTDGSTIVAVGHIIWHEEPCANSSPFVAAVTWIKDESGFEGWHKADDGTPIATTTSDEVYVDWWLPYPMPDPDSSEVAK